MFFVVYCSIELRDAVILERGHMVTLPVPHGSLLTIKGYIDVVVLIGESSSKGLIVLTPFQWALLLQTVTIKHLIISHIICNL